MLKKHGDVILQKLGYWGKTMKDDLATTAFLAISGEPQLITVNYGTNDCDTPSFIGSADEVMAKDISELADGVSSMESLRLFIERARDQFPDAEIIVISPIRNSKVAATNFVEQEKSLCEQLAIPFINAFAESGIRAVDALFKENDAIHPNAAGHLKFANYLLSKINFTQLMIDNVYIIPDPIIVTLNNIVDNVWIDYGTGQEHILNGWKSSDYIQIPSGATTVTGSLSIFHGNNVTTPAAFYDLDKNYIGGVETSYQGSSVTYELNATIPSNAFYVRFCWENALLQGKTPDVTFHFTSLTDLNPTVDVGEYKESIWIDYKTGLEQSLSAWRSTDFIKVNKFAKKVTLPVTYFNNGSNITAPIAFYDKDKEFIMAYETVKANGVQQDIITMNIPYNANFVRFCWTIEKVNNTAIGVVVPKWIF